MQAPHIDPQPSWELLQHAEDELYTSSTTLIHEPDKQADGHGSFKDTKVDKSAGHKVSRELKFGTESQSIQQPQPDTPDGTELLPGYEGELEPTTLTRRDWTIQERMFAPRVPHSRRGKLTRKVCEMGASENSVNEEYDPKLEDDFPESASDLDSEASPSRVLRLYHFPSLYLGEPSDHSAVASKESTGNGVSAIDASRTLLLGDAPSDSTAAALQIQDHTRDPLPKDPLPLFELRPTQRLTSPRIEFDASDSCYEATTIQNQEDRGGNSWMNDEDASSDSTRMSTASVFSLTDSVFSVTTKYSTSPILASADASEKLLAILLQDEQFRSACVAGLEVIMLDRFERNLRRTLKAFAINLKQEAETAQQTYAARFVGSRARNCAHIICSSLGQNNDGPTRHPNKYSQELGNEGGLSDNSDMDETDTEADVLEQLESFIQNSQALNILRVSLEEFVQASRHSNDPRKEEVKSFHGRHEDADSVLSLHATEASPVTPETSSGLLGILILIKRLVSASQDFIFRSRELWLWVTTIRRGKLPPGQVRFEWKCVRSSICHSCLSLMYIRYAAQRFATTLPRSNLGASTDTNKISILITITSNQRDPAGSGR